MRQLRGRNIETRIKKQFVAAEMQPKNEYRNVLEQRIQDFHDGIDNPTGIVRKENEESFPLTLVKQIQFTSLVQFTFDKENQARCKVRRFLKKESYEKIGSEYGFFVC